VRNLGFIIALIVFGTLPAAAEPPKAAVFDFELLDTSLQGEIKGPQADEHEYQESVLP